jgi:hypothetical protein
MGISSQLEMLLESVAAKPKKQEETLPGHRRRSGVLGESPVEEASSVTRSSARWIGGAKRFHRTLHKEGGAACTLK